MEKRPMRKRRSKRRLFIGFLVCVCVSSLEKFQILFLYFTITQQGRGHWALMTAAAMDAAQWSPELWTQQRCWFKSQQQLLIKFPGILLTVVFQSSTVFTSLLGNDISKNWKSM